MLYGARNAFASPLPSRPAFLWSKVLRVRPVSYTHLDVYKRQQQTALAELQSKSKDMESIQAIADRIKGLEEESKQLEVVKQAEQDVYKRQVPGFGMMCLEYRIDCQRNC